MADKTLTVNGQPFTINRDRKAEVSQLSVNGQAFHIDRTAPVIESDPVGNSRPLLGKLVGDAAAAYSLRDLNSKQGDTNVVNVRRESDNEEKIFQAKDVDKIEDWVNGKQETTLPADVAPAAAAYSLRKVKADYNDSVLRIRRSTDNLEVLVGFDANDEVSLNSPITNVIEITDNTNEDGITNSSTLQGFLNSDVLTQNLKQGSASGITVTRNFNDSPSDVLFTYPASGSNRFMNVSMDGYADRFGTGTYDISFDYEIVSSSAGAVKFTIEGSTEVSGDGTNNFTLSGSGSFSGRGLINQPKAVYFLGNGASDATVRIRNFTVSQVSTSAYVVNWFDQAGSNDAVQTTAGRQPQIAGTNGVLLTNGLLFDGTNDFLQTSGQVLTGAANGSNSMYAVIKHAIGDSGYICGSAQNKVGANNFFGQSLYASNTDGVFILSNGNNIDEPERDNIQITQGSYVLVSSNYNSNNTATLHKNSNNTGYAPGSLSYDFGAGSKFTIGARDGSTVAAVLYAGSMKEIIAYDSDQTDNRFKIESNINNYHGLYNDANEQQGIRFSTSGTTANTSNDLRNKFGFTGSGGGNGASGFYGIQLKQKLPNTQTIQISFNSTKASSSSSFGVALYRGANQSDTIAQQGVTPIIKGFNSITLTSNNDDAEFITFSENDGVVFTISDFRVSRINRHGFVQTWYDQSGNGNNAIQIDDTKEPKIIENGGQLDGIKFAAATNGTSPDFLQVATKIGITTDHYISVVFNGYQANSTAFGAFVNTRKSNAGYQYGISSSERVQAFYYGGAGNNANDSSITTVDNNNPKMLVTFDKDGNSLTAFENTATNGLSIDNPINNPTTTVTNIGVGGNVSSPTATGLRANINEIIIYEKDQAHNRPAIEANINNQYQIY